MDNEIVPVEVKPENIVIQECFYVIYHDSQAQRGVCLAATLQGQSYASPPCREE